MDCVVLSSDEEIFGTEVVLTTRGDDKTSQGASGSQGSHRKPNSANSAYTHHYGCLLPLGRKTRREAGDSSDSTVRPGDGYAGVTATEEAEMALERQSTFEALQPFEAWSRKKIRPAKVLEGDHSKRMVDLSTYISDNEDPATTKLKSRPNPVHADDHSRLVVDLSTDICDYEKPAINKLAIAQVAPSLASAYPADWQLWMDEGQLSRLIKKTFAHHKPFPACPDPKRKLKWPPDSLPPFQAPLEPSADDAVIAKLVSQQHAFEWCDSRGNYIKFEDMDNLRLERSFQARQDGCELTLIVQGRPRRTYIHFRFMAYVMEDSLQVHKVRRWNSKVPVGLSWDHQDENNEDCIFCRVSPLSSEYHKIDQLFFQRTEGSITRSTCRIVNVQRIQNLALLARYTSERTILTKKRGADDLNERYLFHGTRSKSPFDFVATTEGFMTEYGNPQCLYGQGCYFAEDARYSHSYAFRSTDAEGRCPAREGKYFHMLVVQVLCGRSRDEPLAWSKPCGSQAGKGSKPRQDGVLNLGAGHDSVRGGPHCPFRKGPGSDDSYMFVVYKSSMTLPEYLVTYTMNAGKN